MVQDAALPRGIRIGLAVSVSVVVLSLAGILVLWSSLPEPALPVFGQVPDFNLVDQDGRPFTDEDLAGRIHVIGFIYTSCPDICPAITAQMRALQTDLARDGLTDRVHLVSITVDPEYDTPERLAAYARMFSADTSSWHFLTGRPNHVRSVIEKGFLVGLQQIETDEVIHTAHHHGHAIPPGTEPGHGAAHEHAGEHDVREAEPRAENQHGMEHATEHGADHEHGMEHATEHGADHEHGMEHAHEAEHRPESPHTLETAAGAQQPLDYRVEHGGRVVLVDREGRIRAFHQGNFLDTDEVMAQIRLMLAGR